MNKITSLLKGTPGRVAAIAMAAIAIALPSTVANGASVPGSWRLHPTFDNDPDRVIVTPAGVYFLTLAQAYDTRLPGNNTRAAFLFRYDTEAETLEFLNNQGILSNTLVHDIDYNPRRDYLIVTYPDCSFDIVRDNGEVKNIVAIRNASIQGSKDINTVSFDYSRPLAYMATEFGVVVINDEKGEVASSINYGQRVISAGRMGDNIIMLARLTGTEKAPDKVVNRASGTNQGTTYTILATPADRPASKIEDCTVIGEIEDARHLYPLADSRCLVMNWENGKGYVYRFIEGDADKGFTMREVTTSNRPWSEPTENGVMVGSGAQFYEITAEGVGRTVTRQEEDFSVLGGASEDMRDFWYALPRKGIYSKRLSGTKDWSLTHDVIRPDASNVFLSTSMAVHPSLGLLVCNHGVDRNFTSPDYQPGLLLSAYDGYEWTSLGLPYTNPDMARTLLIPNGILLDPDNPDLAYFGSYHNGIVRLNLSDPKDILHMGSPYDPTRDLPGFVLMGEGNPTYKEHFKFSPVKADADGNLWSGYYNSEIQEYSTPKKDHSEVWVWPSASRKASTSAATFQPWHKIEIDGIKTTQADIVEPLRNSRNANIVAYAPNAYQQPLLLIDHKGTLDNSSDDEIVRVEKVSDQDGQSITFSYINTLYEDPSTGILWVGTDVGLFTINPVEAMKDPSRVTRIKVSRNDGTNLADYLLNDVSVSAIKSDRSGRKWFATNGGGIVVTSADGREVLYEITSENSMLPSDQVYALEFIPQTNSVMISTSQGLAEYFPSGQSTTGDDSESVRAYPNPVRPDYFGYVTIDGLSDNSLVKIVDVHGNLVKEFPISSGEVKWDVTNLSSKRVKTGVYYILASSGPDSSGFSNVGKILVVN